jgi:hypothetical protein
VKAGRAVRREARQEEKAKEAAPPSYVPANTGGGLEVDDDESLFLFIRRRPKKPNKALHPIAGRVS